MLCWCRRPRAPSRWAAKRNAGRLDVASVGWGRSVKWLTDESGLWLVPQEMLKLAASGLRLRDVGGRWADPSTVSIWHAGGSAGTEASGIEGRQTTTCSLHYLRH